MYKHQVGIPSTALRRSVSYGDPERLQRAMQKLLRGEPITIATVGGSVTGATAFIL